MSVNLRDELQALADVRPERDLWADALARTGAGDRFRCPRRRLRRASLGVGIVLAAALVVVAAGVLGHSSPARVGGRHHTALTGATIQLAGYRFRTPAGFKSSTRACSDLLIGGLGIQANPNAFSAAGSADGGCVEASFLGVRSGSPIPAGAEPVDVGAYQGHVIHGNPLQLYVYAPAVGGANTPYLVLTAQGVTADQLVAIALSGLPSSP